jgi:lipopolysaccharide/colanic/teichoic acid biosynthesis glycosyltransferase
MANAGIYSQSLKRLFDFVASAVLIILLAPLMLAVALVVRIKLGTPILFSQQRPGKDGKLFYLHKFRSMRDAVDAAGQPLPDSERLTAFGKLLRKTSLDELPELFNVLRGEMSLVGPRPLLAEYLPLYSAEQNRRHLVRPGITGWAQVNGRNSTSWDERFALDVWYVDHLSLHLDLQILSRTVLTVFAQEGVSAAGHVTMPKFTGSK